MVVCQGILTYKCMSPDVKGPQSPFRQGESWQHCTASGDYRLLEPEQSLMAKGRLPLCLTLRACAEERAVASSSHLHINVLLLTSSHMATLKADWVRSPSPRTLPFQQISTE